ncbi:MAG: Fe(3+) ABC transporter substrate-binding protein [Anderseniella sp.]|jgi:iron(III) transport system substrate-binding protein|nr:Fe(3+) ABC transporter substrate-binding protein [Anderseniella sp.]
MATSFALNRRHLLAAGAASAGLLAAPPILRAATEINLYSSRHYDTDEALYSNFTKLTGIGINRIEAKAEELVERMKAEGANSPADVFITVDAGNLERANVDGLFQPVTSETLTKAIPSYLRHADGSWFGFSKRARVIMIAKDRMKPEQVPTYESLADEAIKGKLLIRSSGNIYNQSLMGSIISANGAEKAEAWARGIVANMARAPKGGDTDQIRAVAAGEGDVCVSNTYYLGRLGKSDKPEDKEVFEKVQIVWPNQDGRGAHVNISGGGVARHSKNVEGAVKFLEYLVSEEAQHMFADGNSEYPVVEGVKLPGPLDSFGSFKEDTLDAQKYAALNAEAVQVMDKAGWK